MVYNKYKIDDKKIMTFRELLSWKIPEHLSTSSNLGVKPHNRMVQRVNGGGADLFVG